ncbi:PREDICTED: leucine zipper protein 1 [Cyprinodon variegatus]|uniref:Leucine zipper protein 1 n=1 Tax=Cyprinodon variegatus TaxID=28743 RepID=A0A3Q2FX59_CYPVA|nr:PREDICTED: leucine zipper protein 1 [Cyprinodon variegatus]XP_015230145.1 PREDICTED: leucine zipper protein 1 [Cyprinodon variegatus]XP_015230146.1 PREDICTED: leucine zipper protein 1 [Cyprinodon variegatus]
MSDHKDMTHRHLRHKLQSLGRRLDELEEATNKLQKSEDELLDLQDKIIQAEGSNSSLLCDVEDLRKRLLKIQGKDEEVRKAEDLCRTVREKLEEEESLTKELKGEIERLQRRMAELEKLEEAFAKSKSDCSQLCLSLNEEKNLTKKLSSELEMLKSRLKELEGSETRLDKAEQALAKELDRLKAFTQAFVSERKRLTEKQREDERIIQKLTEEKKNRFGLTTESGRTDFMNSRIEDELSSTALFTSKLAGKKNLDYLKLADEKLGIVSKSEMKKGSSMEGSQEEDNKVKELTQEVEKLKNRLKQLELVEEDLKDSQFKNGELHKKFQVEQQRARQLGEQVEQLRTQMSGKAGVGGRGVGNPAKVLENGKAENEEWASKGAARHEKPKFKSSAAFPEPGSPKHRIRELSPQPRRETKLRSKELSQSEEGSPKSVRRALSPAQRRRTPRAPPTALTSDNGITARFSEERPKGTLFGSANSSSDVKKVSVLSRYPPAANEQKPLRTQFKQTDPEIKKRERVSKPYIGSDSESNCSDAVPESSVSVNDVSALEKEVAATYQEPVDRVQESATLAKANGSYPAYRSHITSLLPNDHGSDSQSSASETESTGSRPSEVEPVAETVCPPVSSRTTPTSRYSRYPHVQDSHSEGSSSRSSFDEDLHTRTQALDGGHLNPSPIEIQRVCSPREALRSKAVIKPAIIEIDRKEVMISDSSSTNGKPKISTKPVLTATSKMTSSITIYPSDLGSSRTSSRSSSLSSEPLPVKERHTSTSNIVIGPSSDHRGSISVPYEISISKSEIGLRSCSDQDGGTDEPSDAPTRSKLLSPSRVETSSISTGHQHAIGRRQSSDSASVEFNDTESGFESGSSTTTTVTSWRSHIQTEHSQDDTLSDIKNVTVRSTWRTRGGAEEAGRGQMRSKALTDGGAGDEAEASKTWRAYRATTVDMEDTGNGAAAVAAQRGTKPAEVSTRRYNSATSTRDSESPTVEVGRTVPHAPVTSQSWSRSYSPLAKENPDLASNPALSPASWRRHQPPSDQQHLGSSYDRLTKTTSSSTRGGESWSSRGRGSRTGAGHRSWNQFQSEHH